MSKSTDHPSHCACGAHCKCGAHPSRRTLLQAGLATATGLALTPTAAPAQISGVGVAEGTLPGRTAPHTMEGLSSSATPRARLGIDIHAHYYPEEYLQVMAESKPFGGDYQETPQCRANQSRKT